MSSRKIASPIARVREGLKKEEPRVDDSGKRKASPIARARQQQSPIKSPVRSRGSNTDDSADFLPLSVPFGVECYLSRDEVKKAEKWIKANQNTKGNKPEDRPFEVYSVEEEGSSELESVLVFHWFQPSAGVNINDISTIFEKKKEKWYAFLKAVGMLSGKEIDPELRYPQLLDPVEEELIASDEDEIDEEPHADLPKSVAQNQPPQPTKQAPNQTTTAASAPKSSKETKKVPETAGSAKDGKKK